MVDTAYMSNEEQFTVQNQKQIIQILNELAKNHEMLKVSFSQDTCLTSVISVDVHHRVVYLDIGIDDAFNSRLLASSHVTFSKDDGIRLKWTSTQLTLATLKDGKAIKIALPQKLMRLQRREFFRLTTPIANPVLCIIPIINEESYNVERELELALVDISLGGVGVIVAEPLDQVLVIGASFNQCRINLPDVGETNLTLQVRNISSITMKDGTVKCRVGLQFISPSRANEGLINRYTYNLERQAMALASKL